MGIFAPVPTEYVPEDMLFNLNSDDWEVFSAFSVCHCV